MNFLIYILFFLFGNIIGSFLNVVIYRLNSGKTLGGRSICMSCAHTLSWYELIPVFSFIIQRGKCRKCASKISNQYPIVEFITGIVFMLIVNHFMYLIDKNPISFVFYIVYFAFIFSILIIIAFYDSKHKIIPDKLSYTFTILSFILMFFSVSREGSLFFSLPDMYRLLSGPIIFLFFLFIWYLGKGKYMGFGDVKLSIGIGWFLGLSAGVFSVFLSFWIGAIISIILYFTSHKKVNRKTQIPFAPFMIVSILIVFFYNLDLLSLNNLIYFIWSL